MFHVTMFALSRVADLPPDIVEDQLEAEVDCNLIQDRKSPAKTHSNIPRYVKMTADGYSELIRYQLMINLNLTARLI